MSSSTRASRAAVHMLIVVVSMLIAAACATDTPPAAEPSPAPSSAPPLAEAQQAHGARPVAGYEVSIPKLGVRSDLVALGLNPDRSIQVPPLSDVGQLGLYQPPSGAPLPGEPGPAVILGHVNGGGRAGVFAHLDDLVEGDHVDVTTPAGPRRFTVERTQLVLKAHFPTKEVYSDTAGPELRLITCGGEYDPARRNYLSNVLVFAKLDRP